MAHRKRIVIRSGETITEREHISALCALNNDAAVAADREAALIARACQHCATWRRAAISEDDPRLGDTFLGVGEANERARALRHTDVL